MAVARTGSTPPPLSIWQVDALPIIASKRMLSGANSYAARLAVPSFLILVIPWFDLKSLVLVHTDVTQIET